MGVCHITGYNFICHKYLKQNFKTLSWQTHNHIPLIRESITINCDQKLCSSYTYSEVYQKPHPSKISNFY